MEQFKWMQNKPELVSNEKIFPSQGDLKMHCVNAQTFTAQTNIYRPCDIFLFTNIWTYEKQAKRHQKNATHHWP
jgi:hypothetical protein